MSMSLDTLHRRCKTATLGIVDMQVLNGWICKHSMDQVFCLCAFDQIGVILLAQGR
jgi:hypothetical protein